MEEKRKQRILAVAAHADDEILGAGGTLALHAQAGHALSFLVLSTTATSRPGSDHEETRRHRSACAQRVADLYGAELHLADLPDNAFDTVPRLSLTRRIEDTITAFDPTTVYTHSSADLSLDHRIVAECAATATRPVPGARVRTLLAFEVRSATEWGTGRRFHPTWFQPLTPAAMAVRSRALGIYASEIKVWPHSRSEAALDAHIATRGAHCGHPAAEAFEVVRHTAGTFTAGA